MEETLDYLKDHDADIILMEINMPILCGVATCKEVTKKCPSTHVIALSMYDQHSYFKRMIQFGAKGYLLKNDSAEEIEKAIRILMEGERYISRQMIEHLSSIDYITGKTSHDENIEISNREKEVLLLVANGFTDQQIAEQLFISYHTMNSHRKNIIVKLDAKNTAELIKKSIEKRYI